MSSRKRRRRYFRDLKFKHFLGKIAPDSPQFWGAFGALTFLPLRAALKSHATLLTADYRYRIAYEIKTVKTGLEGEGVFLNCYVLPGGGTTFMCNSFLGGKF